MLSDWHAEGAKKLIESYESFSAQFRDLDAS